MTGVTAAGSLRDQPLREIVSADSRTAAVFDRLGLDYCCNGHHTIEDAAAEHGLVIEDVLAEIGALGPLTPGEGAAFHWPNLDDLTAHIVTEHHGYVRAMAPVMTGWLDKLVSRHGQGHPELLEVRTTFHALAEEMATHMAKEENILFPFVNMLAVSARAGGRLPAGPFGTILNPIRMMEADHREAGDAVARLRALTNNYTPPEDGCTAYRLCYSELARYAADLHRHVHLENNVLFPRALELEQGLA